MAKFARLLNNPRLIVPFLGSRGWFHFLSDESYLRVCYKAYIGKDLDLNDPKGFNEKLQWLKLHDRNPLYCNLVDKYSVKEWVAETIGSEYVIPCYAVWNSADEIDVTRLPSSFVIKPTHDSGNTIICKDKSTFDLVHTKKSLTKSLKKNFYWNGREWPYKNVKPRIIAEELLPSNDLEGIPDYKFMCFQGKVKLVFTCTGRASGDLRVDFFDTTWSHMSFTRHYQNSEQTIDPPSSLQLMITLAERLSQGIPFVRVDFYEVNRHPFFGEMTFFPGCGFEEFTPDLWDDVLGSWIDLSMVPAYRS